MLRGLVAEPIANLSAKGNPAESFSFPYAPEPAVDAAFEWVRQHFAAHLPKPPAIRCTRKTSTPRCRLAAYLRTSSLVKAALPHR
jgi:hypothetical protein